MNMIIFNEYDYIYCIQLNSYLNAVFSDLPIPLNECEPNYTTQSKP